MLVTWRWLSTLPSPAAVTCAAGPAVRVWRGRSPGLRWLMGRRQNCNARLKTGVKTDARAADHLARLLPMDQIVAVRAPSAVKEAARTECV